jgi:hypothetical protein
MATQASVSSEVLNGRRVSVVLAIFSAFFIWYFLHGTI